MKAGAREQAQREQRRRDAKLPRHKARGQRERQQSIDERGRRYPPGAMADDGKIEHCDERQAQERRAGPIEALPRPGAPDVG